ncbi:hypothetical protein CEXT_363231 [Caerostris extrusa]|uniref:Uncharacterized protein n=1 Tax=Caerostris extrusa TaxID=172846 RepID=A0AAV4PFM1_CAEEX|nr:hypothetical protein CEXT_363231 [Caerostris extrusa]
MQGFSHECPDIDILVLMNACGYPGSPAHSSIAFSTEVIGPGTVATYTCDVGFEILDLHVEYVQPMAHGRLRAYHSVALFYYLMDVEMDVGWIESNASSPKLVNNTRNIEELEIAMQKIKEKTLASTVE